MPRREPVRRTWYNAKKKEGFIYYGRIIGLVGICGRLALPYGADGAVVPVQKFRDVQKLYAAMTDGKMEYVLYGVENQSGIHYAMPVKNGLYDVLEYVGQVEEAAKSHRRERKHF